MKRFTYDYCYLGQQITVQVCARSVKEAAEKLNISPHTCKKYAVSVKIYECDYFEGIRGWFDSGELFRGRPDLIRVKMPLEELKALIREHRNKKEAEREH